MVDGVSWPSDWKGNGGCERLRVASSLSACLVTLVVCSVCLVCFEDLSSINGC